MWNSSFLVHSKSIHRAMYLSKDKLLFNLPSVKEMEKPFIIFTSFILDERLKLEHLNFPLIRLNSRDEVKRAANATSTQSTGMSVMEHPFQT